MIAKRIFDFVISLLALLILIPFFFIIALVIILDSKGGVFYKQERVGKNRKPFQLFKFRTMYTGADKVSLLTVGEKDSRITKVGYSLRKYKLDELPQLINVLKGDMSLVGPRPEVKKYTDLYDNEQQKVLLVKPGITDFASIQYSNESELLVAETNPELAYINKIMPAKLEINLKYINERNFFTDIKIIFMTIKKIISN